VGQAETPVVSAPSWTELLSSVAEGGERLVLETADGHRAVLLSEQELTALEESATDHRGTPSPEGHLTPRETEILQLIGDGSSGVDVAHQLGLATNTVAQHLAAVRRKFGVRSSAAAVAEARAAGLLRED